MPTAVALANRIARTVRAVATKKSPSKVLLPPDKRGRRRRQGIRPARSSVLHSVLVHDAIQHPMEAVLDLPMVAGEFQQPPRWNLRAHDEGADGSLRLAIPLAGRLD